VLDEIRDAINLAVNDVEHQEGILLPLADSANLYEIRLGQVLAGSSSQEASRFLACVTAYYNAVGTAMLEAGRLVDSGKRLLEEL
jgi:hypothetical protein